MSIDPVFDIIWLQDSQLVVLMPLRPVDEEFAAAALILKGDDGTDQFVPYEGFCDQAPIAISLGQTLGDTDFFRLSVLGFRHSGEPVELASYTLDQDLVPHDFASFDEMRRDGAPGEEQAAALDVRVLGFGERHFHDRRVDLLGGEPQAEIGVGAADYQIVGPLDYSDLLANYLLDMRGLKEERFNGFLISGVPRDGERVGPSVHLRPLHHYQLGLALRSFESEIETDDLDVEVEGTPLAEAAILSRHGPHLGQHLGPGGGVGVKFVPEFTLHAGPARETVDFVLRNGVMVHWRRQFEVWSAKATMDQQWGGHEGPPSFVMRPFDDREHLAQQDGTYVFHWAVEEAVLGDVVGVMFGPDQASIDIQLAYRNQEIEEVEGFALFVFMGEEFVPLTADIWNMVENKGLIGRLEGHISQGLKQGLVPNYLTAERVKLTNQMFERDGRLAQVLGRETLNAIAERAPFGPELMVYRDHILRLREMAGALPFIGALQNALLQVTHGKIGDVLRFEMFKKAPALAHVLVFNKDFRERFQGKTLDPHSLRLPLLEFVLSKLFSDRLIEWALRLKGESQAILWHLALKRPHMVERLYELKLEPDMALNPFDDKSLDIAEKALTESSHIDLEVIEHQVMPVLKVLGDESKLAVVRDFAEGMKFGADGKKLNIGELSVCLGAVEQAGEQWQAWCDEADEVFEPLLSPLRLELPAFAEGADLTAAGQPNDSRRKIGHLIHRLVDDKGLEAEVEALSTAFVERVEARVLLDQIQQKLDLALKYHHDLAVGVATIYESFAIGQPDLVGLARIQDDEWPKLEQFGPTFADPFLRDKLELQDKFAREITDFSEGVHPGDGLFRDTLKASLGQLEASLPKLVWLQAGQALEDRVEAARRALGDELLQVRPHSAKLRRSKSLAKAVQQLILAERIGPPGWPVVYQSLDIIEKSIAPPST